MDGGSIIKRSTAACAALLAATLAAPGAAQQGEEAESADVDRTPRTCLSHPTIRRTKILSDRNIVFMTRDEAIYNNELPKACTALNRNSLVNYNIVQNRMCAGDRFQVLWETNPGNYVPAFVCQLGAFVPITAAELEDLTAMTEPQRERRPRRRSAREAVTTEQIELPPEATTTPNTVAPDAAAPAPAESAPAE
jgi:hypothetical protein